MRTLTELQSLLQATVRLAWGARWRLAAWYCLGFALHTLGLQVSAILGARHDLAATLAFVAGVTASLLSLIAMINTLRPGLRAATAMPDPRPASLPPALLRPERFVAVLTATLAPFLAVYAVWGIVEDEARELFRANIAESGYGGVTEWSISWAPERLPFYAILLAGSWLLRFTVQRIIRRFGPDRPVDRLGVRGTVLAGLGVLAEAVVVFATFATVIILGKLATDWLGTRVVTVRAGTVWRDVVAALPDLRLPFDLTLPQFVVAAADWLGHTALPALGVGVLLPLMWLALTAVVFGWREFSARSVVAGTAADRLSQHGAARLVGARHPVLVTVRDSPRLRAVALFATEDLRTKYLPVLQSLRLVLAGGPRLVGAFLVLATALAAVGDVLLILIGLVVGPTDGRLALALDPPTALLIGVVVQPLLIALYVATFDRALLSLTSDPGLTVAAGTPGRTPTAPLPAPGPAPTPVPGN